MSTTLSLHEVVDELDGRSIVEEIEFPSRFIVAAIQHNENAYTTIYAIGRTLYVKETPDEILQKIKLRNQMYPNQYLTVDFRIYHDMEKAVLVDMTSIRSISSLTRFQTEFKFRRGNTFVIRTPLEWLDVPKNKIKKPRKVNNYASDL